jgi:tetratricopeptide (TPR) repeat protein
MEAFHVVSANTAPASVRISKTPPARLLLAIDLASHARYSGIARWELRRGLGMYGSFRPSLYLSTLIGVASLLLLPPGALPQRPGTPRPQLPSGDAGVVSLHISVRDSMGAPPSSPATVQLNSNFGRHDIQSTRDASTATFQGVSSGEYDIEVHCIGYKEQTEHLSLTAVGSDFTVYVYIHAESEPASAAGPPSGVTITPKLQAEIEKGLDLMRKKDYAAAKSRFAKAAQLAPGNPDVAYLQGTADLGLQLTDEARKNFEHALSLNPSHEKALLALGELQLRAGETDAAIATLEKAYSINGAGWRTHLLLAAAYNKAGKYGEAETHASRAVNLAQDKGATATMVLAEVQVAEGKLSEARHTWEQLIARFPQDPLAVVAQKKLEQPAQDSVSTAPRESSFALPTAAAPTLSLLPVAERRWAPLDTDEKEYPVAPDASCNLDDVLHRAYHRAKSQLQNFEKFTATEHIEHQEIDRYGRPGLPRSRNFSYIVFIHPFAGDSLYLEESRNGSYAVADFPTSLATTGLNGLGFSLLQPAFRDSFGYQCQGLANVRGQAAWQVRFEENPKTVSGVRRWQRNGTIYNLPIKGRIWLSATSFDVVRIETDLEQPNQQLELTRDHLSVDYGQVSFTSSKTKLWLPWSAEMYMELHGKRYHHKHFLTDYMLFAVDSSNNVGKPKVEAAVPAENSTSP